MNDNKSKKERETDRERKKRQNLRKGRKLMRKKAQLRLGLMKDC